MNFFRHLFPSDFMPHGYCYLWQPRILWLHAISDSVIAVSYYVIVLMLIYFVRKRRDLPFNWVFVMFGVFIFGCGTTHAMEVWNLWHGTYRLSGVIKAITAVASVATAAALVRMVPKALALPSPEGLRLEITERNRAEQTLLEVKSEPEARVLERTSDLRKANEDLVAEIERHKKIEDDLRRSEERFRLLVESILDFAIFGLDTSGNIVTWNMGAERIKSFRADEIIGRHISLFYPSDDINGGKPEKALVAAAKDGRFEEEGWRLRKDGSRFWAHETVTAVHNPEGNLKGFSKITRDLTEQKRAEQERRKLSSVVENSADFIGIASLQGEGQFVNPAGQHLVGLEGMEEVRRTKIIDYVAENDRQRLKTEILPAVFANGYWDGETFLRNFKTRELIPMWHHIFFITEEGSDRRLALATISRDIRERKRSEEALLTAHAAMARMARVTLMGELTASIAHEVNQPLAAVVTNSYACGRWLSADPPNLGKARQCINEMVSESERAAEVIKRIRSLAKRDAPQRERVGINDVISEVIKLLGRELDQNHVGVRTELVADLPVTVADRVQLQQVISNLMLNGIEAMAGVTERPKELLICSRQAENQQILVSISDSGAGFGPKPPDHLFEAFFTTKREGMGLGLSISRSIVEAHGGRLWATTNATCGATFHFTLPLAASASA